MKIKIDFFNKNIIDAIGAGIYQVSIMNNGKEEVLYIGDSKTDMETGQNAKMDTIGVAWGFRGAEELRENNATYIVEKPEAILEYVI